MKKKITALLLVCVVLWIVPIKAYASTYDEDERLKLSNKSVVIMIGKTRVVRANKKVTWKVSDSSIASIRVAGKKKVKITGKKQGECVVTAFFGTKRVNLQVIIKEPKVRI